MGAQTTPVKSDRDTRERAMEHAVAIEIANATAGNGYSADRVVNVAKKLEEYLLGEVATDGR